MGRMKWISLASASDPRQIREFLIEILPETLKHRAISRTVSEFL